VIDPHQEEVDPLHATIGRLDAGGDIPQVQIVPEGDSEEGGGEQLLFVDEIHHCVLQPSMIGQISDEDLHNPLDELLERNESEQQRNYGQQRHHNQLNHSTLRDRNDAHAAYRFEAVAEIRQ